MAIAKGDRLPAGKLMKKGAEGMDSVDPAALKGRVALFAVPGAFTSTCTNAHMPSFVRAAGALREKGVERILCVTVNDPSVADAWAGSTGANGVGIEVLADADGAWTKAMGQDFDAPQFGMWGRSKRYALLARDGVVEVLNVEDSPGACTVSAGDALLKDA